MAPARRDLITDPAHPASVDTTGLAGVFR